ncbi:MAG TPA: ubiquitin-like small modifier protein 1 [Frankiaceae bacterium]|nr:ubiquitin-like small modifier protein 1 [Frankiaceae bacterium]
MSVRVRLPGVLAEHADGQRSFEVEPPPSTVGELLDLLDGRHPRLCRRLRDETGSLRRHVNVYVDGENVRTGQGLATPLDPDSEVQVLPSVAGG